MTLDHEARERLRKGWHAERFEPAPNRVKVECAECGRVMWLPPSKVAMYRRCGAACTEQARQREREARRRSCATCEASFYPRPVQIADGRGLYCSRGCIPVDHLMTPEAKRKAAEGFRKAVSAGRVTIRRGSDNHMWRGGPKASLERHRESRRLQLKAYRRANPDKVREFSKRRQGRKLARLPHGTIPSIGAAQRWKCAICRSGIRAAYHVDHIVPLARGGQHVGRNIQLLCPTCNVRKNAKDPIDYMRSLGRLL